jgi:hypothetical protein
MSSRSNAGRGQTPSPSTRSERKPRLQAQALDPADTLGFITDVTKAYVDGAGSP